MHGFCNGEWMMNKLGCTEKVGEDKECIEVLGRSEINHVHTKRLCLMKLMTQAPICLSSPNKNHGNLKDLNNQFWPVIGSADVVGAWVNGKQVGVH